MRLEDDFILKKDWAKRYIPKQNQTEYVFVYGTLKRGYSNHRLLFGCRGWKAEAKGIDLFSGPYFPYARRGSGTARGELYEVSTEILELLDHLEGHPTYYRRELHPVRIGNAQVNAWIYLYQSESVGKKIEGGEWKMI